MKILSKWWHFYSSVNGFTQEVPANTLRLKQHGGLSADDIFKCIFLTEYCNILIPISPKFVPEGAVVNKSVLILVKAFCWLGDKSLPEVMVIWHHWSTLRQYSPHSKNFYVLLCKIYLSCVVMCLYCQGIIKNGLTYLTWRNPGNIRTLFVELPKEFSWIC